MTEVDLPTAYFGELLLVFDPIQLIEIMQEMNTQGLWEIFRINFKGWILTIIWLIEACLIIWMPIKLAFAQKQSPFSLSNNKWYTKHVLQKDFSYVFRKNPFLEAIQENCVSAINDLENGKATRFSRVSVYYLKEESQQYISVENINRARNGTRENSQDVIHLLAISSIQAKTLIEKYHAEKAFIFDY